MFLFINSQLANVRCCEVHTDAFQSTLPVLYYASSVNILYI